MVLKVLFILNQILKMPQLSKYLHMMLKKIN